MPKVTENPVSVALAAIRFAVPEFDISPLFGETDSLVFLVRCASGLLN